MVKEKITKAQGITLNAARGLYKQLQTIDLTAEEWITLPK